MHVAAIDALVYLYAKTTDAGSDRRDRYRQSPTKPTAPVRLPGWRRVDVDVLQAELIFAAMRLGMKPQLETYPRVASPEANDV